MPGLLSSRPAPTLFDGTRPGWVRSGLTDAGFHCVRCAGPLVDVRHPFLERGFLYRAVPAWYCAACGEHYYHVGTINAIQRDAARRLASA